MQRNKRLSISTLFCFGRKLRTVATNCPSRQRSLSTETSSDIPPHGLVVTVPDKNEDSHPYYNYTSGRWLYNEQIRLVERHLVFDVKALLRVISQSCNRPLEAIVRFSKLAEGGSYRVFEAVFDDGFALVARIPFPCTIPRMFGIASEVATMQFLRVHGLPLPPIFSWASSAANPVGTEYMIMAKVEGYELEHTWYTMTIEERMSMTEKIVNVEKKLFQIRLPANGSIYHTKFLESQPGMNKVPIDVAGTNEHEFCIGPSTQYLWWYKGRDELAVNRGPWVQIDDVLKSVGERELAWLERFGKPRYPREPLYRAFYNHREVDPEVQKQSLRDYLKLISVMVPEQAELREPTIRHPDLSPSNIFVSKSGDITGLIDWQHTSILPLFLQAKIPKHFQNWGDEDSENFERPSLPSKFDHLAPNEQEAGMEIYRRRQMHYFYLGYTSRNNEAHFKAIGKPHLVWTNKLFDTAARPWEGDNTSLKAEIIRASKYSPIAASSQVQSCSVPIQYSKEEMEACLDIDEKQQEADAQMQTLRDCFTTNIDGWVSSDLYEQAKARVEDVRKQMIEAGETEEERVEVEENWPFQDHDEID